ncbi:sigma-70 family RNA polymerase sigma factor [Aestuariimicrobium ganziense]|uniref:sigma-70 family RNA polymerase sigma factor n=1 Tax=Aestuariimicrobium ganziense TaxID=2773677 RepID=UPI0019406E62|nr:sigma-70 family RNA polymerase sigma factor [Aestuariimicrobium ganziense]
MDTDTLTAQQEIDLAIEIEAGLFARALLDDTTPHDVEATDAELQALAACGELAWQRLWQANVRLAWWLARRAHRRFGGSLDDLGQDAQVALAQALMRWDHTRGTRLSTHAWRWIGWQLEATTKAQRRERNELSRYGAVPEMVDPAAEEDVEHCLSQVLPAWFERLSPSERDVLLRRHGVEPTPAPQVADDLGTSVSSVRRLERQAVERARRWATMAG